MSTAPSQAPAGPVRFGGAVSAPWARLAAQAGLSALTLSAAYVVAPTFGHALPAAAVVVVGAGALAVVLAPRLAVEIAAAVGLLALALVDPTYAAYHLALVGLLFLCRRRGWALALALALGAVAVPKTLFWLGYGQSAFHAWLNEPALAVAIFATLYWWRETRDGRVPSLGAERSPFAAWCLLYLFPSQTAVPLVLGPGDLWRARRDDAAAVLRALAAFAAKAAALVALRALFPDHGYGSLSSATLARRPLPALWGVVALSYVDLMLALSGTIDVAVAVARLYGWQLPAPFRWALLAWNPVELWRRWGIFNRRFLLKNVYFPLGGGDRRRLLNVMLTFLASALVMHSGWLGSKYWAVGVAGWRDWSIYFSLQGAAVCACLLTWRLVGKDPRADRELRWSWGRLAATLATLAMSALMHVIILPQSLPLGDRWRLIARCLGLV
ncbi:MAG TPA: MBOAT family O-acyltransferase [Polyangia bacterium]